MLKRFAIGLFVAAIVGLWAAPAFSDPVDIGPSAVEVVVGRGHGSGVYIGHGYVLTAAHVAAEAADGTMTIKRPRNEAWTDEWAAVVVWTDARQDFALLRIQGVVPDDIPVAKTNCTAPKLGADVTIVGWPRDLGRVQSRGYIAGGEAKRGPWAVSYVVVAPIFFGNSGGPVYDEKGEVLALAVGILEGTSLAIVIPTSAVCAELPADAK